MRTVWIAEAGAVDMDTAIIAVYGSWDSAYAWLKGEREIRAADGADAIDPVIAERGTVAQWEFRCGMDWWRVREVEVQP